ncbi:hypothetical protein A7U60_g4500 [Sanghuangporus baumii]|uniref:Chromo domain-containing protein n=1 Tax=Sanghuangporus baumii TaxID=108892 RepID=A0A9Q5HYE2_SANBA|nr:hypothetical protein A7U60_g4500 [Sanghuangporus baumii]
MIRPTKKMDDKWFGPFKVVKKIGASAYRLKLLKTWKKVHPVFNEILLKPAIQLSFESQKKPPPLLPIDDKWFGPFEVVEKVSASAYRLKLPKTWKKVHPVFNKILLKLAVQPSFESQKKPPLPPPVIIDEQEEYEVEEILNSRLHRGKLQFLVKWVGYEEATWQPESDVKDNAQESIQEFYRKHPSAPRKLTILRQSLQALYKFTSSEGLCGWSGRPTLKGG